MNLSRLLILTGLAAGVAGAQDLEAVSDPQVRFVTNMGEFVMELDIGRAPLTVEHFLTYVREGHYEAPLGSHEPRTPMTRGPSSMSI